MNKAHKDLQDQISILRRFATGEGPPVVVVESHLPGMQPYAGLRRGPVTTALDALLAWIADDRFVDVCIATGRGDAVPRVKLSAQTVTGDQPCFWRLRGKGPAAVRRVETDADRKAASAAGGFRPRPRPPAEGPSVIDQPGGSWQQRLDRLLAEVERLLGLIWTGADHQSQAGISPGTPALVLVDDGYLDPDWIGGDTGLDSQVERDRLSRRFGSVLRAVAEAPSNMVRLAIVARSGMRASGWCDAFESASNETRSRPDFVGACYAEYLSAKGQDQRTDGTERFPVIHARGASAPLVVRLPSVTADSPYGSAYVRAATGSGTAAEGAANPAEMPLARVLRGVVPVMVDPLEEAERQLDRLVGLSSVKEQIKRLRSRVMVQRARGEMAAPDPGDWLFLGNPGTGKTTVAELMGRVLASLGLVSRGHVVKTERSQLVGEYVGQTAPKVRAKFEEARGGVLFIDEIYALVPDGTGDAFGQEAIDTIVALMEIDPYKKEVCVIAAGYRDDVERVLKANAGLKSRFPQAFHMDFQDYRSDELWQILTNLSRGYTFSPEAEGRVMARFRQLDLSRPGDFGNAREVVNLWTAIRDTQSNRLITTSGDFSSKHIEPEDVDTPLEQMGRSDKTPE